VREAATTLRAIELNQDSTSDQAMEAVLRLGDNGKSQENLCDWIALQGRSMALTSSGAVRSDWPGLLIRDTSCGGGWPGWQGQIFPSRLESGENDETSRVSPGRLLGQPIGALLALRRPIKRR